MFDLEKNNKQHDHHQEEEEENLFKANAENEEDSEHDRATQG